MVAVPADDTPAVDVLAFDPNILLETFDARAKEKEKGKWHEDRYKTPFFIALDETKKGQVVYPGLKDMAKWHEQVALDQVPAITVHEDRAHFFERMKRQIADFIGIDVSKIELDVRIKS